MNVNIQKYAPPIAVMGIALYLGWPPAAPMDLGEDVVRAKSVRWNVSDLETPSLPEVINANPFAAVLVESPTSDPETSDATPNLIPTEPTGPSTDDLRIGLSLGGIAQTDRHRWAIINGSVYKVGERVPVIGLVDVAATIQEIVADHVTVVSGPLTINLKQEQRKRRSPKTTTETQNPATQSAAKAAPPAQEIDEEDDDEDEDGVKEDVDPNQPDSDRQRSEEDIRAKFFPATTKSG